MGNMVLLSMIHESTMLGKVYIGLALRFALVIAKKVILVGLKEDDPNVKSI